MISFVYHSLCVLPVCAGWEEVLALKDQELANLQSALGELSYESEAAEKLRFEIRAVSGKASRLAGELAVAQEAAAAAEARRAAAEAAREKVSSEVLWVST